MQCPELKPRLEEALHHQTAGDPTRPDVRYTHPGPERLSTRLGEEGQPVSPRTVGRLLGEMGLKRRPLYRVKTHPGGKAGRHQQFLTLAEHRERFESAGLPVLSIDSKKQLPLGADVYREGRPYGDGPVEVLDHDFPGYAEAVLVPHGIYDPRHQHGHLNLNPSKGTAEFARDSLLWYWRNFGRARYPDAEELLLLCDCGGSNSYASWQWKIHLERFAERTGLSVRVSHYPVHCSKYNPIERMLFSQVHLSWAKRRFGTAQEAARAAEATTTRSGLSVTTRVWEKEYESLGAASQRQRNALPEEARTQRSYNYVIGP